MAKQRNRIRMDLVNHGVSMIMQVLQAVADAGADSDEIMLIKARVNLEIDTRLLLEGMADFIDLISKKPDGETH